MGRHLPLTVALAAATLLRVLVMVAYYPVLWFNGDSFEYIAVAQHLQPYQIRPDGYPAFLRLLRPLPHNLAVLAGLQHLMGLTVAVLLYALLRRYGLRDWVATLAVLPVLFNPYQLQLEQLVMSDTLCMLLLVAALVLLLWAPRPSPRQCLAAGVLLAGAVLVRTVVIPIAAVLVLFLLLRRVGWARLGLMVAGLAVPVAGYMGWFAAAHGTFSTTSSDGVFLYSRTMVFADCNKLQIPPVERQFCDATPPSKRRPSEWYIWHNYRGPAEVFSNTRNSEALAFALHAIEQQPLSYLHAVTSDIWRAFRMHRTSFPNAFTTDQYQFVMHPTSVPAWHVFVPPNTAYRDVTAYYGHRAFTRVNRVVARFLINYQRHYSIPGPVSGLLFVLAGVGLVFGWRDRRRWQPAAVLAVVAFLLLLVPAATAEFDYRYVLPAIPTVAAAAALALAAAAQTWSGRFRRLAWLTARPAGVSRPLTEPRAAEEFADRAAHGRSDLPVPVVRAGPVGHNPAGRRGGRPSDVGRWRGRQHGGPRHTGHPPGQRHLGDRPAPVPGDGDRPSSAGRHDPRPAPPGHRHGAAD